QLLDGARREILRLVDHQQRPFLVHRELTQERFQRREQDGLVEGSDGKSESGTDRAQHIVSFELRADDLHGDDFRAVELLEKASDNRRLPGADVAGDDDETLALVEAVFEVCEGALVAAAAVEERRVGIELEGLAGQPEEGFVHRSRYLNM